MRIADAGAKTWLLATLAGWALAAWLLALLGMGGVVERLEEDPALLRPLPAGVARVEERLGPLPQYAEAGTRPLFTEDRRPQPYLIDPMAEAGEGSDFDFVLTSVLRTPGLQMVILQPTGGGRSLGVKVGEAPEGVSGWSLARVEARSAVFNGPEGERTLELRQFDGVGGEAPTAMAAPPPAAPAAPSSEPASPSTPPMATPDPAQVVMDANQGPAPRPPGRAAPADARAGATQAAARTSQEQVDAIRRRIEERRARLRQDEINETRKQTP